MKTVRVIAALVLVIGAAFAAYYSYTTAFAPPPMHSASAGPPPGFSMPGGNGPSGRKESKPDEQGTSKGGSNVGDTARGTERRPGK